VSEPLAETGAFSEHLSRVGEALDAFLRFDRPDPVARIDEWRSAIEQALPEEGIGAERTVTELIDVLVANGARISDPGFWGFITTGPTTVPVIAAAAAMVAAPQRYSIHAFNLVEEVSLDWLRDLCGLPPVMKGVYVSGGSVANLVALGAARQAAFERVGLDPAAGGIDGRSTAIYASAEVHHTVQRSAGVLGLGRAAVRAVPVDDCHRMDTGALRELLEVGRRDGVLPIAVVATAGTTNTGAIDPLRACGELAGEFGAWFHVDGAYGLVGRLDPRVTDRFDGLDLADSAIVDPHKWLAAPVGVAAAFVRDRTFLHRAFTQEPADYLEGSFVSGDDIRSSFDSMGIPYGDFAVELSAPARGVIVWAILREQGVAGIRARVMRDNDYARRVARRAAEHPRLESLTEPELSIACIRYVGSDGAGAERLNDLNDLNERLLRRLVRETGYLPSATVVDGAFAIRPCFINARTTDGHVEGLVDAVVAIGDELTTG
jgi:aromatic-L-amino-acid/L-tryptophan decarboxylase